MIQNQLMANRSLTTKTAAEAADVYVVLPAWNEAAALPVMLAEFDRIFRQQGRQYHVTIVDDGSTDATAEIAERASSQYPVNLIRHPRNLGLAAAMRTGLTAAAKIAGEWDVILTMDSDNTHPIGLAPRMLNMIREGHDVVVASRFRAGSRVVGVSWFRRLTARVASLLFRIVFPIRGIRDYTCGYRAYRASAVRQALQVYGDSFISEQGFSCMVDILLKLGRLGLLCGEAPMILRYDLKDGDSKMPVGKTIFATLRLSGQEKGGHP